MEKMKEFSNLFKNKLDETLKNLDENKVQALIDSILSAKRIYLYGLGRSGLSGKSFAMRLMHLGINVYVVGESVVPSMRDGDLLIISSGSGAKPKVIEDAKTAKGRKVKIACITQNGNSELAQTADIAILLIGKAEKEEELNLAPMGTLFEITLQVFLDGMIAELMKRLGKTHKDMQKEHNLLE